MPRASQILAGLLLGLILAAALPAQAKDYVRVYTMGRNAEGKLMRVIGQPVMLWKDGPELRKGLTAGIRAIHADKSLSLDANDQLKLVLEHLPKPAATATTDINRQAMLEDVEIGYQYLVIVQNNIPYHKGGGPFVGIKAPGSQRVRCTGVDLNGLITFLERFARRPQL